VAAAAARNVRKRRRPREAWARKVATWAMSGLSSSREVEAAAQEEALLWVREAIVLPPRAPLLSSSPGHGKKLSQCSTTRREEAWREVIAFYSWLSHTIYTREASLEQTRLEEEEQDATYGYGNASCLAWVEERVELLARVDVRLAFS